MLLSFSIGAVGCRITDHSEEEGGITASDIHIPASGYQETDLEKLPQLTFDADTVDAGRIAQGTVISRTFGFTNSGGSDLIIADVRSTCGCTVGKNWPKQPVKPGERGSIDVTFDSEGRSGVQNKSVSIVSNADPSTHLLILRAEVMAPGQ
ncbi:MAG: DUF1573 domain-containing protein [Flavobacteriales bacterium]